MSSSDGPAEKRRADDGKDEHEPRHSRYGGHEFRGDLTLNDQSRAHLGDKIMQQFVTNVYPGIWGLPSGGWGAAPRDMRDEILNALTYSDMNRRRNQLDMHAARHFEWIWNDEQKYEASRPVSCDEEWAWVRNTLFKRWNFDAADEQLCKTIRHTLGSAGIETLMAKTCPQFVHWLQSVEPVFWISGKPASGKSSLMSYLSRSERTREVLGSTSVTAWHLLCFFFDYRAGQGCANSMEGLMRSLLFQMVTDVPQLAEDLFKHTDLGDIRIKHNELPVSKMVNAIITRVPRLDLRLCIFIDGLDEFGGSYSQLIDIIKRLADGKYIKICMASRPEPELSILLSASPTLVLQHYNQDTIVGYTQDVIDTAGIIVMTAAEKWSLILQVLIKAQGVILWCQLVSADIRRGIVGQEALAELQVYIDVCDSGIEHIYVRLMDRVPPRYIREASYMLYLIGNELLNIEELAKGLFMLGTLDRIDTYPKALLSAAQLVPRLYSRLGGLIEIVPSFDRRRLVERIQVRTVHKTLSAYLGSTTFMKSPMAVAFREQGSTAFPWFCLAVDFLNHAKLEELWNVFVLQNTSDRSHKESNNLQHKRSQPRPWDEIILVSYFAIKNIVWHRKPAANKSTDTMSNMIPESGEYQSRWNIVPQIAGVHLHGTDFVRELCSEIFICTCQPWLSDRTRAHLSSDQLAYYYSVSHGRLDSLECLEADTRSTPGFHNACCYALLVWRFKQMEEGTRLSISEVWRTQKIMCSVTCHLDPGQLIALCADLHLRIGDKMIYLLADPIERSLENHSGNTSWVKLSEIMVREATTSSFQHVSLSALCKARFSRYGSTKHVMDQLEAETVSPVCLAILVLHLDGRPSLDNVRKTLALIDLALLVCPNINEQIYPGGTVLHLCMEFAAEILPPVRKVMETYTVRAMRRTIMASLQMVDGFLDRGADPTVIGPVGTPRQMLNQWINSLNLELLDERSVLLLDLHTGLDLCVQETLTNLARAEQDWSSGNHQSRRNPWNGRTSKAHLLQRCSTDDGCCDRLFNEPQSELDTLLEWKACLEGSDFEPLPEWRIFIDDTIEKLQVQQMTVQAVNDNYYMHIDCSRSCRYGAMRTSH